MKRCAQRLLLAATVIGTALVPAYAGDGSAVREIGAYAVHYNAMPAAELDREVAERYELPQGSDRCVVTVAVIDRETGAAVEAAIMGSAMRPDGRMHHLDLRKVHDEGGVYYVAVLSLESAQQLDFKLEVQPEPSLPPQTIRFSRTFAGS